jgi:hypothetical protein
MNVIQMAPVILGISDDVIPETVLPDTPCGQPMVTSMQTGELRLKHTNGI